MRQRAKSNGDSAGKLHDTTTGRPVFSAAAWEVSGHEHGATGTPTRTKALCQASACVAAQEAADGRHAAQACRRRSRQVVQPRRAVSKPHEQLRKRRSGW